LNTSAPPAASDHREILRVLLRLAIPVLLEQLLGMAVSLENRWLTGNFLKEDSYLAAMNEVAYLMWFLSSLFAAISIGAMALVARFVGAGDWTLVRRAADQSLTMGLGIVMFVAAIGVAVGPQFLAMQNLEPDAAALAQRYLAISLLVLPAIMLEQVGIACLHGIGDTVSGLIAMTAMNIVNVALSTVLTIGWGPFPKLGWDGLAIGMACGHAVAGVLILWRMWTSQLETRFTPSRSRPDREMIGRLLRIGLPGGADVLALVGCQLWYLSIVNHFGNAAAAAHGIGVTIESASFVAGSAFSVAAATLTGQFLGAGDPRAAKRAVLLAYLAGGGIVTLNGLLLYIFSDPLARAFIADGPTEVIDKAALLLRIMAVNQPFLAASLIFSGGLRGAGDTRWPLVFTFVGFLGVRIPFAYLLAFPQLSVPLVDWQIQGFDLGIRGAWYALATDVCVRSLLVTFRFFQGGWQKVKV